MPSTWNIRVHKYTRKTLAIAVELLCNDEFLGLELRTLNKGIDDGKFLLGKTIVPDELKKAAKKNSTTGLWNYILQVDLPIVSRGTLVAKVTLDLDPANEKRLIVKTKSELQHAQILEEEN